MKVPFEEKHTSIEEGFHTSVFVYGSSAICWDRYFLRYIWPRIFTSRNVRNINHIYLID